jgi:transcriptional regulator with XRE-family HTH domain
MARAALQWSVNEAGKAAGVSYRTIVRLENDQRDIQPVKVAAIRRAFESAGIRFLDDGANAGGVVPPPPARLSRVVPLPPVPEPQSVVIRTAAAEAEAAIHTLRMEAQSSGVDAAVAKDFLQEIARDASQDIPPPPPPPSPAPPNRPVPPQPPPPPPEQAPGD